MMNNIFNNNWTEEEILKFKNLYNIYGKNWKEIKRFISTKSIKEIRSYGKNYLKNFNNLNLVDLNNKYYNICLTKINNSKKWIKSKNFQNKKIEELNDTLSTDNKSYNSTLDLDLDLDLYNNNINFKKNNFFEKIVGSIEIINKFLEEITHLYNFEMKKISFEILKNILLSYEKFLLLLNIDESYNLNKSKILELIDIIKKKFNLIKYYEVNPFKKYKANNNLITINYFNNFIKYSSENE